jgi:hypothetical protein
LANHAAGIFYKLVINTYQDDAQKVKMEKFLKNSKKRTIHNRYQGQKNTTGGHVKKTRKTA